MLGSIDNDIPRTPISSNPTAITIPDRNFMQRRGSRFEEFRRQTQLMLEPSHKVGQSPSPLQSFKAIITASWLNLFFPLVPLSWVLHFALPHSFANRDTLIFVFSFLAIIPLTKLRSFATEGLVMRVGPTLGGLLNSTLGNTVELILAIVALVKCQLQVVQAVLVGSIISNLLLVLGLCFFSAGLKYFEQGFGVSIQIELNSSLLTISVISVLLPAAFHFSAGFADTGLTNDLAGPEGRAILSVSRGVSLILISIYVAYLIFQLRSHTHIYQDTSRHISEIQKYKKPLFKNMSKKINIRKSDNNKGQLTPSSRLTPLPGPLQLPDIIITVARSNTFDGSPEPLSDSTFNENQNTTAHHFIDNEKDQKEEGEKEEREEIPTMSLLVTMILLVVVTVLIGITGECLVDAIDGLIASGGITREFISIILLPIVGNAAENLTAATESLNDKLRLCVSTVIGSSIQIALSVIPFLITLAWILDKPLTLLFDPYESISMFLAVFTVNCVAQNGKSHWLDGFILISLYLILALTFWFYPGSDPSDGLLTSCH